MTISDSFKSMSRCTDRIYIEKICKELTHNNPGFNELLERGINMGGITNPIVLLYLLRTTYHAGLIYGEAKARAEFTDPFKELGKMPQSVQYEEHEH